MFLGNFEFIKHDVFNKQGYLNTKYFSLILGGRRMIYDLNIFPIEIKFQSLLNFFDEKELSQQLYHFILYGKISNLFMKQIIDFLRKKLRVTISEMHNEKIKVQKFYFKYKYYDSQKEKLRISK